MSELKPGMHWEYQVFDDFESHVPSDLERLRQLGQMGWEAVGLSNFTGRSYCILLKRPGYNR